MPARRRKRRLPFGLRQAAANLFFAVAVIGGMVVYDNFNAVSVDPIELTSISKAELSASARPMPVCSPGIRINCVVDGDTFWLDGTKYRIANIDTPELKGKCEAEQTTAKRARQRLAEMVDGKPIRTRLTGKDRYGRTLVLISDASGDIGDRLVGEGMAEVWGGDFIDWCAG